MKRIIIVVEGQTEQEFVKQCVAPYLLAKHGITSVTARLIGKPGHKGGDVRFNRLKVDLTILLHEPDVVVSTFIDLFKLGNDFPKYDDCQRFNRSEDRIACLEEGLYQAINTTTFIPYIQRHEFDALLFASENGFKNYFKGSTCAKLAEIIRDHPNPEDINNTEPPSYRLLKVVEQYEGFRYDKVNFGNILALEIGIETMLKTCPRFSSWIDKLRQAATI
ncbi:DUF4276 family protein [Spirosoma flavus]